MSNIGGFCSSSLIPLKFPSKIRANTTLSRLGISPFKSSSRKSSRISCTGPEDYQRTTSHQPQLNLSVLRFTLGIPGLDESYLPRWIGYAFGSLLLLNHFLGSDSTSAPPAQLRSEALGLSLAGFSALLPYLGKFLTGASALDQKVLPEDAEQIFVLSQNVTNTLKEDLAWGTYVMLRNTNTVSVLISIQDALCVRGYWSTPKDVDKTDACAGFQRQIENIGLFNLEDSLYFPQLADERPWEMLPKGTRSVLVQPVRLAENKGDNLMEKNEGFILLASSTSYAYSNKDRAWIGAIANKFRGLAKGSKGCFVEEGSSAKMLSISQSGGLPAGER